MSAHAHAHFVTVTLVSRTCPSCGKQYRVTESSPQKFCSRMCEQEGWGPRRAKNKQSAKSDLPTRQITVSTLIRPPKETDAFGAWEYVSLRRARQPWPNKNRKQRALVEQKKTKADEPEKTD